MLEMETNAFCNGIYGRQTISDSSGSSAEISDYTGVFTYASRRLGRQFGPRIEEAEYWENQVMRIFIL
jgi:hypothetical protein